MSKIVIGMPLVGDVSQEVYEDHMRFMFYIGRRYTHHDFYIAIKMKSEQFRARNAIVTAALQVGADYLLMLDDDMITNPDSTQTPTAHYEFLERLLEHMTEHPEAGVVGALYFQRGGSCFPVMLTEERAGKYRFLRHDEITDGLQEVAVAGGGVILIRMAIFDKLSEPWFAPEHEYGTDVQICAKARETGWKVYVDSSVILGHVCNSRSIVHARNRHLFMAEAKEVATADFSSQNWYVDKPLRELTLAAMEYTGMAPDEIKERALDYQPKHFPGFTPTPEYYRGIGRDQLCRQVCYHHTQYAKDLMEFTLRMLRVHKGVKVLDFACGSAPIGFEVAKRNNVDFVDLNGAGAFEFLKWRTEKIYEGSGPGTKDGGMAHFYDSADYFKEVNEGTFDDCYDVIILMDAIEHFEDWKKIVDMCARVLKPNACIITNYFTMGDDPNNVEHISMDRPAVKEYFVSKNVQMLNNLVLVKNYIVQKEE